MAVPVVQEGREGEAAVCQEVACIFGVLVCWIRWDGDWGSPLFLLHPQNARRIGKHIQRVSQGGAADPSGWDSAGFEWIGAKRCHKEGVRAGNHSALK